jgi:hypothetical protein
MTEPGSHQGLPAHLPANGWRTATRCGPNGGNCVAVNLGGRAGVIGVRDTKPVDGPVLLFGSAAWSAFLSSTR